MVVINPTIENTLELDKLQWSPLLTAHKKRSSIVEVSSDHKYLRKTKRRRGNKRDAEFYNLAFWNSLLTHYRNETGSQIYSPTPYIAEGKGLIMEYGHGIDLDRLLRSGGVGMEDMAQILRYIGQLFKIKNNEGLVHNDLGLRHLLVNGGLFTIDLENARYGNGQSAMENKALADRIKKLLPGSIDNEINEGLAAIPALSLADKALTAVKSIYGERANFYLRSRYRDMPAT